MIPVATIGDLIVILKGDKNHHYTPEEAYAIACAIEFITTPILSKQEKAKIKLKVIQDSIDEYDSSDEYDEYDATNS